MAGVVHIKVIIAHSKGTDEENMEVYAAYISVWWVVDNIATKRLFMWKRYKCATSTERGHTTCCTIGFSSIRSS